MSIHVAILQAEYLRMVLTGVKAVECRLSKTAIPPFDAIEPGERLFLKASGGPFMATATVDEVVQHADRTPEQIDALREQWNPAVCGAAAYWQSRRDRRFATFIRMRDVEPFDVGPAYRPQSMRAWYVLPDASDPIVDVTLSGGALRNHYAKLPRAGAASGGAACASRGGRVHLEMPDGRTVETDYSGQGEMLRWRGWGRYYKAFALRPGDTLRFIALGGDRWRVRFRRTVPRDIEDAASAAARETGPDGHR